MCRLAPCKLLAPGVAEEGAARFGATARLELATAWREHAASTDVRIPSSGSEVDGLAAVAEVLKLSCALARRRLEGEGAKGVGGQCHAQCAQVLGRVVGVAFPA